ncbi:hypothetical protein GIB67_007149, partial [Kingdonia uniflora]
KDSLGLLGTSEPPNSGDIKINHYRILSSDGGKYGGIIREDKGRYIICYYGRRESGS